MLILTPDTKYRFEARDNSEDDCDIAVVRETWVENVYQIHQSDLDDTGVFIDIGANIGAVSVYAASLNTDEHPVKVIAYEPEPDNLRLLKKNIESNEVQVDVRSIGVSDAVGTAFINERQGNSRLFADDAYTEEKLTPIHTTTLAGVFSDNDIAYCDVLKMDIEGYEYPVIEAASIETLQKIRYLTMEFDAADRQLFGGLIYKLTQVFNLHILGSPERGGYIYGRRY